MNHALDVAVLLLSIGATALLALGADWGLRQAFGLSGHTPPRHRLADHPQPYRVWTVEQRPERDHAEPRHQRPRRRPRQGSRRERALAEKALTYWLAGDGVLSRWDRGRV